MNETVSIIDSFAFFSNEEDYAIFIGQKGEMRKKQTETELPWDFDPNFKCIVSAGMEKRIFFYTTSENILSIFRLTIDEESIENIFVSDLAAVGLNDFRIDTLNIVLENGSVFISGHISIIGGTDYYFVHFSSAGVLQYQRKQYQSSDDYALGKIAFLYSFCEAIDTAFFWCKEQPELCYYEAEGNDCHSLFEEKEVFSISSDNGWLVVLMRAQMIKAPVEYLYSWKNFKMQYDSPYPPFKTSYGNDTLVMIQAYESRFTDIESSTFDYYHGGIYWNVLKGDVYVPEGRQLFKKDEFSNLDIAAMHKDVFVAFHEGAYQKYVHLLDIKSGGIEKIFVGEGAKNCNFLSFSGNYLYVGNWSGLVKVQVTDYKQRIEKVFDAFAKKNRIGWKVDYEPLAIEVFEDKSKTFFGDYFDADYVAKNFSLPEDFRVFLELCHSPIQIPEAWELLEDAQHILDSLPGFFNLYAEDLQERKEENEMTAADTMWLRIALYSDKHEFLICCDRSSAVFGKVFDSYDDHPWMDGGNFEVGDVEFGSFIDFLENWYGS
jgi:hypothetical protein